MQEKSILSKELVRNVRLAGLQQEGRDNNVKLGKLVVTPFNTYKKALATLKHRAITDYHKVNMISICEQQKKKVIEENRKIIVPIINIVILCGAQNIQLRGHRDGTDLQKEPEKNYEKSFAEVPDKCWRDEILASHIGLCDKNASYISKTTQHEIIQCCGDAINKTNLCKDQEHKKFHHNKTYETTGISIKEQLAICMVYFDTTSYEIQEKFCEFIDVVDVSGENIARTILQELDRLNLDSSYCRGQAYDGGSNMSGKFKGVQARIAKLPHLKKGKHAFKKMCETRWVEKHIAVLTFLDTLPCLPVVLKTIFESSGSRGSNVFSFLRAIQSSEFLVSFWTNSALGSEVTAEYMDVLEAMKLVEATLTSIREQRYKSTDTFKKIFRESEKLAMEMGTQINNPSKTNLQKKQSKLQFANS
ncbi:hypothetical protein PR048_009469 [Dryococelus australis]|uniref:DUF4371 domain-containing protein n=1 Tax=Dryococelus australis TaxID=614101 RepID=A0ABQ9I014_9NEOP|nr:hypothetical protein PR048_009469 [Dryococelus australis]